MIFSLNAGSQEKCQEFCNVMNNENYNCQFYAFYKKPIQNVDCHLYDEPFSAYINHCDRRIGPRNKETPSTCFNPQENSCEISQNENCNLFGRILESNLATPSPQICQEVCSINADCMYWEWSHEKQICNLYDSDEKQCDIVFGPRGDCTSMPTTTRTSTTTARPPSTTNASGPSEPGTLCKRKIMKQGYNFFALL